MGGDARLSPIEGQRERVRIARVGFAAGDAQVDPLPFSWPQAQVGGEVQPQLTKRHGQPAADGGVELVGDAHADRGLALDGSEHVVGDHLDRLNARSAGPAEGLQQARETAAPLRVGAEKEGAVIEGHGDPVPAAWERVTVEVVEGGDLCLQRERGSVAFQGPDGVEDVVLFLAPEDSPKVAEHDDRTVVGVAVEALEDVHPRQACIEEDLVELALADEVLGGPVGGGKRT